jgi:signal transduction histidine kinase
VASIAGLATLSIAREAIAAVEAPIETLHEFVLSGIRSHEHVEILPIEASIGEAINSLADFARERRVRIQFDGGTRSEVLINRHEITRAIRNLLHNAIKYSWRREDGRTWVTVSVMIRDRAAAIVSVENWGVPVPAEEKDLVFELGFRGRFSSDRGRVGTGVGLTDSLRIAKAHGGSVRVESRPASPHANPRNYDQPFVTTISLELPLARR